MTRWVSTVAATLALVVAGSVVPAAAQASEAPRTPTASLVRADTTNARAEAGATVEAQAKKGYKRCKKGRVCLFTGKKGKGAIVSFRRGTTDLRDYGMNDEVSSAWNRTGKRALIFMKRDFNGRKAILYAGNRGNVLPKYNDHASSLKVKGRG